MSKCTNEKVGRLLHAYEIGVLSEDLVELVEVHILECDYCMNRIKEFGSVTRMLSEDEQVQQEIAALDQASTAQTQPGIWARLFNTDLPLVLRPAFLLVILMILISITALAIVYRPTPKAGPIQEINLIQNRSNNINIVLRTDINSVSVSFICRDYDSQTTCSVLLEKDGRDTIYYSPDFRQFDAYETGRLLLPYSDDIYGNYRLLIDKQNMAMETVKTEYTFKINRDK